MGAHGSVAQRERAALCDLLEQTGPLAPTLCTGWATSDLAAHLYVRDRKPWAAIGILVPPLAGVTDKAMESAKRSPGYEGLVAAVRAGPPSFVRPLDEQMNAVEFFVHHEDVRRAKDSGAGTRDDDELDALIYKRLRLMARFLARRVHDAGLVLEAPGFGSIRALERPSVARLSGPPQELALYLSGRREVAEVKLDGPEEAVRAVTTARFGL